MKKNKWTKRKILTEDNKSNGSMVQSKILRLRKRKCGQEDTDEEEDIEIEDNKSDGSIKDDLSIAYYFCTSF